MVFQNENTWFKASTSGEAEEFHSKYNAAVQEVKKNLEKHYPMYIDGEARHSKLGEFPDVSPSDIRVVLGYFQKATKEDVNEAVEAAERAFQSWGRMSYYERVKIFRGGADIMAERKFSLAALITVENGKNRFEAMADVDEAIDMMRYYCQQIEENKGFDRPVGRAFPNEETRSILKPYGVWGVISPFNFPLAITVGMSSGALITGNTIVLKPASDTPFIALKFYEIMKEADLPTGVMNYITGSGNIAGAALIESRKISGIAFTGSKEVGFTSYTVFSKESPRPFIAEMGGKNAAIVTAKADLDAAAEGVMKGAFGYCGQKCSATSRVYVAKEIKQQFTEKLVEKVRGVKVGNPLEQDIFMGPIINQTALKKYEETVKEAQRDGKILVGGIRITEEELSYGFYVTPTIIDNLPKNHRLFKEELFVPILCLTDTSSLEEAVRMVNDVEYGLTAGVFSKDPDEIEYFFDNIQTGVTYANRRIGATTGAMVNVQPFVGWKHSGSTGKGAGGQYYLQQFLREQSQSKYT